MKPANFDSLIRFRCYAILKQRIERIARIQKRRDSDMYRLAMEDYVDYKEKELNLQPIPVAPHTDKLTKMYLKRKKDG